MKDEHAYGEKMARKVAQGSFIKGHSFPIGLYLNKTFFMRPVFRFIKHNLSIYYLFYALLINVDVQKLHIII